MSAIETVSRKRAAARKASPTKPEIEDAIREGLAGDYAGNKSQLAKDLGLSRSALYDTYAHVLAEFEGESE